MAATQAIQQYMQNTANIASTTLVVAAGVTIYEGTMVSINGSGLAIAGVTSARLAGVAQNTASAGEVVTVYSGASWWFPITSPAATMIDTTVYAADNAGYTATPNTAIVGRVIEVSATKALALLTLRA